VSDPTTPGGGTSSFSAAKIPLLFGAVLALLAASVFNLVELGKLHKDLIVVREDASLARKEVAEAREQLSVEISRSHENATASTLTSKNRIDSLKAEIEAAKRLARSTGGDVQKAANRRVEELEAKQLKAEQELAQKTADLNDSLSQVRSGTDATRAKVDEVSKEVSEVKTSVNATKSDLEKTIEGLKSVKGDLGVQSGLIATNATELEALKEKGERTFLDFQLPKTKTTRRIGDLQIQLKAADPAKNRYTIVVIADDKSVEKRDKTINEPVQFQLATSPVPYEIVVNEVKKDMIVGYVSEPKARQGRK
jgi:hypothetical protein